MDSIIEINKKLNNEKNPDSATMLRRRVEALDGEVIGWFMGYMI